MKSYGTITKLHSFQEFGQLCTSLLVFSVPVEWLRGWPPVKNRNQQCIYSMNKRYVMSMIMIEGINIFNVIAIKI
jgi:hypothetical protein